MLENTNYNDRNRFIIKNEEESNLSQEEEAHNNTHLFVCEICGTNMPLKEKEDHLLCHEIESEERKNDIIINVSPNGEIEQNSQNKYSKFFNNVHAFDYYPISVIKDINKLVEDKKRCAICLENFQNGDESIILPCVHIFHSKCIRRWVQRKKTCPFCNYKINIPRLIKKFTPIFNNNNNNIEDKKSNPKKILKNYLNVLEEKVHLTDDQNENRNEAQDILTFGRIDYEDSSQNNEIENSYNDPSSYSYNPNSYNSSLNSSINLYSHSILSSHFNSNSHSHFSSDQNSSNSNSYNSNSYNSNTNSVATSNLNINSNASSNSNTNSIAPSNSNTNSYNSSSNSSQVNSSPFDTKKDNNSIKDDESYKYCLNNSKNYIDKFKSNQNKEESSCSIKNSESSEEEDEKEEEEDKDEDEDEIDDKEDEKDSEDKNEKKDDEKNELQNNIIKNENNSIDNNIENLYKLNLRRNSMTYNIKNNNDNINNAHRISILSTKVNNQNQKYNYINNLTLEEKIKYRKRSNSTEIIDINTILNKEVLFKNKNAEILLYKLKNLNISLEKEKSYANYFKYLKDKDNPNNKNNNETYHISNDSDNQKNIVNSPIELFNKNDDNLHKKVHKSNIFDILRKSGNN